MPSEPIKGAAAAEADLRRGYAPLDSEGAQVDHYVHDQLQQIKQARLLERGHLVRSLQ